MSTLNKDIEKRSEKRWLESLKRSSHLGRAKISLLYFSFKGHLHKLQLLIAGIFCRKSARQETCNHLQKNCKLFCCWSYFIELHSGSLCHRRLFSASWSHFFCNGNLQPLCRWHFSASWWQFFCNHDRKLSCKWTFTWRERIIWGIGEEDQALKRKMIACHETQVKVNFQAQEIATNTLLHFLTIGLNTSKTLSQNHWVISHKYTLTYFLNLAHLNFPNNFSFFPRCLN